MSQSNQEIDLQAAEWAVRLGTRDLTAEEQAELDQWLAADIRHRGALLRARASWADLDRLAALRGHGGPEPSPRPSPEGRGSHHPGPLSGGEGVMRRWFVAASFAVVVLGGTGAWWTLSHRNVYVSNVGQIRRVALSDGSSMVLNTATEATVNFDKAIREIQLSTGEGLFHVAKDPTRPFVVRAGPVSVRAVGTVFSVSALDQRVDVTVTEGVVYLIDNASGSNGTVIRRVAANEHATVMEARRVDVEPIPHDEAERRLAWRDGMVDFAGEPLAAAVGEINRHNYRHVVVDDPTLAARPVVGLFRANDPDGFAETVAMALGAQPVHEEDGIHLRPK